MTRSLSLFAGVLALGILAPASAQAAPYCREFTKDIVVGGRVQQGYGTACQQPDGSWQVVNEAVPDPIANSAPIYAEPVYTAPVYNSAPVYVEPRYGYETYYAPYPRRNYSSFSISIGDGWKRHGHRRHRGHGWGHHKRHGHHKHGWGHHRR